MAWGTGAVTSRLESVHRLPDKHVVLLGIGHTNAYVLHRWRERPPRGARLTCVSKDAVSAYSGMLPGVLAGQYPPERMEIDLAQLCAAAGARLVVADVTGLDVARRHVLFADRSPLPFDVLSIGTGSVPTVAGVEIRDAARLVPIKPMRTFLARVDERLRLAMDERRGFPIRVAIVAANTRLARSSRRCSCGTMSLGSSGRVPKYLKYPRGLPSANRLASARYLPSGRLAACCSTWLNHDESRGLNSLDMLEGPAGRRYIRHYMFDFGSTLSSGSFRAQAPRAGNEYILEWEFVAVAIRSLHPAYPQWAQPVTVHFRKTATGWQTVRLDHRFPRDAPRTPRRLRR